MTATVTKLNSDSLKEASIPSVLSRMEKADKTLVIHITGGRWDVQFVKGSATLWELTGIMKTISDHFSNVINGIAKLSR